MVLYFCSHYMRAMALDQCISYDPTLLALSHFPISLLRACSGPSTLSAQHIVPFLCAIPSSLNAAVAVDFFCVVSSWYNCCLLSFLTCWLRLSSSLSRVVMSQCLCLVSATCWCKAWDVCFLAEGWCCIMWLLNSMEPSVSDKLTMSCSSRLPRTIGILSVEL